MASISACPNCGQRNLYQTKSPVSAGGGHAPNYLPGLGGFFRTERFTVVVCRACGLTRFFARQEALEKLTESSKWERV
jgi:predicted nucleic-acid-binding Zn-ribbon protein